MKNSIVHLTLTTNLFISGTFENNVLCLLQPYVIAFECLLHIFDATWYRCKVVISSIMLCFFIWTMCHFLRHWFFAHLAKGNLSCCHHLVRSPSSSSVCCYCNILIFSSETPMWIKLKLWRTYLCKVFYIECSFSPDPLTNMASTCNSFFLIGRFLKQYSPLTPHGQLNWNLVGSIYVTCSMKIVLFVSIR